MNGSENKFVNFVIFAAAVAGGTGLWLLYRFDKSQTSISSNPKRSRTSITVALSIGEKIGIDWSDVQFPVEEFARGLVVEKEHGTIDGRTNVTNDDMLLTGKIAWAHLNEIPDYYTRLDLMEQSAGTGHRYRG